MEQQFLSNGNLLPGIHTYKMQEFENQFVNAFTSSKSRTIIFENFNKWLEKLLTILPPRYIWLDGSYLTQKVDPKDIDLVVFYYPEDIQSEQQAYEIQQQVNIASRTLNCDAYFCLSFEHWTPQQLEAFPNQNHKIMQTYWMGQFCFDRKREPKGIVQLDRQELLTCKIGGKTS